MRSRQEVGRSGEDLAVTYLEQRGWQVLDRNWFGRGGELDVVALDVACDTVVGVEVKTRRSTAFGRAAEAVTPVKLRRMRSLVAQWLDAHDLRCDGVRLDVIAIEHLRGAPPHLEHLRGV
jgi:putative endonuclease